MQKMQSDHCRIFIANTPKVSEVYYPGLYITSWSFHCKKTDGWIWWCCIIQTESRCGEIYQRSGPFLLAESLGGADSLVEHAATMSHASMTDAARKQAGITDDVIRLSVGLEDSDDLIEDLSRGLEDS